MTTGPRDRRPGVETARGPATGRPDARPARAATRNVARRRVDPARVVAWRTLRAVAEDDAYANLVLPGLLREQRLSGRDAGFATELAYGALRGRGSYDPILAACTDRPEIDPPLLDALRLGAHQLLAMRVPAHAAVAATVDLVRAEIGQGAAGFANAVLRRVTEHDLAAWFERVIPAGAPQDARLAVRYSHPEWIVRALRDSLAHHGRGGSGLEAALEQLLAADNAAPTVTLAALPGLTDPDELGGRRGRLSPYAVHLAGSPGGLRAVREGRVRVQDEGSQAAALALADAPLEGPDGGRWLDLCAGPGGKTALLGAVLAQRLRAGDVAPDAVLLANESAPHRAELVTRSVAALPPGLVRVHIGDGRTIGEARDVPLFDRVLVDAPCTGLGALRRRPEARWRRTPADLAGLAPLQRALLTEALRVTRPGGVVAYVTCSPHPAETTLVVDDVLRRFARQDESGHAVHRIGDDLQLWPDLDGCDAMFVSTLRVPSTPTDASGPTDASEQER